MAIPSGSLLFVLFLLTFVVAGEVGELYIDWTPIDGKTLKDPKIIDLAKFAVSEHNKNTSTKLHFVSVTSGDTQKAVGYTKFKLMIFTTDGNIAGRPRNYDAIVWAAKNNRFILKSFKQLQGCRGCFSPIANLKDPQVMYLAKSAVSEHNKKAKTHLNFVSLINGQTRPLFFMFVISAKDVNDIVGRPKNYLANVWYRPWEKKNPFILLSFEQIQG